MRRKPLENDLIRAIQRLQIFSVAFTETLRTQQLEQCGIYVAPGITFHHERDKQVLDHLLQFVERFPSKLQGSDFPSILLLSLWLAECRVSPLGSILEGEVGMPYAVIKSEIGQSRQVCTGQFVYRAAYPSLFYPATCLSCSKSLNNQPKKKQKTFCNETCRSTWNTLKEQFQEIAKFSSSPNKLEYATILNAYFLYLLNPHYRNYKYKDEDKCAKINNALAEGLFSLYKDKQGNAVDLQGNLLPNAHLITEAEDILG